MKMLSVGNTIIYALMSEGKLPWVKVRGARKIPRNSLMRYLQDNMHQQRPPGRGAQAGD
jgi:excisionase family DNA binding protein